jgi:DNA (cytosine-5)-methyltransferase 1
MKNAGGDFVKDIIATEVSKLGYSLKYEKMYAPDYGVPQKRRRVIFLGWKSDISEPSFPLPTHTPDTYVCMKDVLIAKNEVPLKYYHSQKMITGFMERLKKNKENGKGFGAQFINENQPCYTISARYYKDGCDALVKYSDTEIRKLTEKEAARVQTFPDSFVFPVSSVQTYKQIGNAVPCLLGYIIAKSILKSLNL